MSDPIKAIEKKLDEILKAVRELGDGAAAQAPGAYDQLSGPDVNELRRLAEHRDDLAAFSTSRIAEAPAADGAYDELGRLGLVTRAAGGAVVHLDRRAEWVVARHDESRRGRWALRAFELAWSLFTTLAGVVVGWWLASH